MHGENKEDITVSYGAKVQNVTCNTVCMYVCICLCVCVCVCVCVQVNMLMWVYI